MTDVLQKIEEVQEDIDDALEAKPEVKEEDKKRKFMRRLSYVMLALNIVSFLGFVWTNNYGFGAGMSLATIFWYWLIILYSRMNDRLMAMVDDVINSSNSFVNILEDAVTNVSKKNEELRLENTKLHEKIAFLEKPKVARKRVTKPKA
jgi:hypothetical protein